MVRYRSFTLMLTLLLATPFIGAITPSPEAQDPNWCGNKHKNLVQLQTIVQGAPGVQIPEFIGIPTARVEAFLRQHAPSYYSSIFQEYAQLVNTLNAQAKNGFVQFLKNATTKLFRANRTTVEHQINLIQQIIRWTFANNPFPFTPDEQNLFNRINTQKQFFMVRSTGIEDSQTMANAGGNVSVAYVNPTEQAIADAMGNVVASYFGMQSLKNRIAGGETLSATTLCLPVLIQVLVGEPLEGGKHITEIPVSGVAFTTNQSLSATNFPVTEINASYGHGEGVVANRVTADRYYVTPSRMQPGTPMIYPMLYYKSDRLVPHLDNPYDLSSRRTSLISLKNSTELAQRSALSETQVKQLYTVLKKIETAYGQPMDVEFVVLDQTIYIVQARPAMRHATTPSYVALERLAPEDTSAPVNGITLVPGSAKALIITNPADIIVIRTLDEADQMPNSGSCKAVIVAEWASSLSHAAVNFISHGIPCMYIQNLNDIKKLLPQVSTSSPLIIDAQRKVCFLWNNRKNINDFIVQGWFEHPIADSLSLFLDKTPIVILPAKLIPHDRKVTHALENFKRATTTQERKTLLTTLVEPITKRLALTETRMRHAQNICDESFKKAFTLFKTTFETIVKELTASIDSQADHFEILFYHKMLQALLYQTSDSQRVLAAYNYSYFLNELLANQVLVAIKKKLGNSLTFNEELTYAKYCPGADLAQQWRSFLTALELYAKSPNAIPYTTEAQALKEMLIRFDTLQCLPLWFATEFHQAMKAQPIDKMPARQQGAAARALITKLTQSHTTSVSRFLHQLEQCKEEIIKINTHRAPFTKLAAAQEAWQQIRTSVIQPLTDTTFLSNFNQSSLAVKMIACDCIRSCIDTIDASIKTVKTSNDLSWEDRITQFKIMLDDFNNAFRWWMQNIMPENALKYHQSWPLKQYLQTMQEIYDLLIHNVTIDQGSYAYRHFNRDKIRTSGSFVLQRSENFSVNAAILGSTTAFERHFPTTAEDIFMLIHQNSLVAIAGTYASLFAQEPLDNLLYLPPIVKESMTFIESKDCAEILSQARIGTPQRIGITYTTDSIELLYNMALSNHSSTLQIKYDHATQQCTMAVQFLGEARNRWEQVALLAFLSKDLSNLEHASDVVLDTKAGITSWSWHIKKSTDLPLIATYLMKAAQISFGYRFDLAFLGDVYKKTTPLKTMLPPILTRYTSLYDDSQTLKDLMAECQGNTRNDNGLRW